MIRVNVLRMERLGSSEIRFEIEAHRSTDGTTWYPVPGAPQSIQFQAEDILTITQDPELTDAEKGQALVAMFKERLLEYQLDAAEQAQADIEALVTAWPVTITL